MNLGKLLIVLVTLFADIGPAFGEGKTLRLGMYYYPPFLQNDNGDLGICHKIIKRIFEPEGYTVKPIFSPLIRTIRETEAIRVDAICSVNPHNSKGLALADYPNARLDYYFWVRSDSNFQYDGVESLARIKVINVNGYNYTIPGRNYQKFLESAKNKKNIFMMSGDDVMSRAFKLIHSNRAQTICLDDISARYILQKHNMQNLIKSAGRLPNTLHSYFAVSDQHPKKDHLLKTYNEGHIKLDRLGAFDEIFSEYNLQYWPQKDRQERLTPNSPTH